MKTRRHLWLAIVLVGCSPNPRNYVPSPSSFSEKCDLQGIVMTSVPGPDREAIWGHRGMVGTSSGEPGRRKDQNDFDGAFSYRTKDGRKVDCRPEDVNRFMRSIKAGISKAARANGTRLFGFKDDLSGTLLRGFQMKYEAGKVPGTIEAEIEPDKTPAGLTTLYVRIHEVVELK